MKYDELKKLTPQELKEKCEAEKILLNKTKTSHFISPVKRIRFKESRKLIAQIKTIQNEK